jgi:hypothetical protein
MNTASIVANKIPVTHTVRPDVNREFLQISVPNGWDDVQKLTNKVLSYDNRDFIFSGWNSDCNEAYFYRLIHGETMTATVR